MSGKSEPHGSESFKEGLTTFLAKYEHLICHPITNLTLNSNLFKEFRLLFTFLKNYIIFFLEDR
jgi:hypothetical protein